MISTTSISPPIKILALTLAAMVILIVGCSSPLRSQSSPLALHSENPHYFIFRGRPTVLITSAEYYGAVLNLDFDYGRYLKTLSDDGLNRTRIFSGAYVEPSGAFNIAENTLAPGAGRYLSPWARSEQSGYAKGGNKFDLKRVGS